MTSTIRLRVVASLVFATLTATGAAACSSGDADACTHAARYEIVEPGSGAACEKNGTGLVKDTSLGGRLKSGQAWTSENRP